MLRAEDLWPESGRGSVGITCKEYSLGGVETFQRFEGKTHK
jgi:hypothetical protein